MEPLVVGLRVVTYHCRGTEKLPVCLRTAEANVCDTFLSFAPFLHQYRDLSISRTCTGNPTEPDDDGYTYYSCQLTFDLVYFHRIKQVKIGENSVRSTIFSATYPTECGQ